VPDPELEQMISHIKSVVYPEGVSHNIFSEKIQPLLLNMEYEQRIRDRFEYPEVPITHISGPVTEEGVVVTDYLLSQASAIITQMEKKPFGLFSITGPQGCGKMSLLHATNALYESQ
jgi:pantothenate kinase-related protein Tda10